MPQRFDNPETDNCLIIKDKILYPKEKETTHKGLNGVPIILHGYFDQDGGFVVEKTEIKK